MVTHSNQFVTYLIELNIFVKSGILMVTAISLARRRRDGLSPGSPSDSISYSTGQLRVRTKLTLREQGSFSRSQSSLFIWSLAVPSSLIVSIFRLYTFTSYRLLSKDWGLFQILVLPSRCRGIKTLDLIPIPLPAHTAGWNDSNLSPLVWSQSKLGFSHYLSPC